MNSAGVLCERGPRPSDGGVRAGAGVLGSRLAGSRRRGPLPRWGEQATSPALRRDIRYRTHGSQGNQSPRTLTVNNPFGLAALTAINLSCHPFGPPPGIHLRQGRVSYLRQWRISHVGGGQHHDRITAPAPNSGLDAGTTTSRSPSEPPQNPGDARILDSRQRPSKPSAPGHHPRVDRSTSQPLPVGSPPEWHDCHHV